MKTNQTVRLSSAKGNALDNVVPNQSDGLLACLVISAITLCFSGAAYFLSKGLDAIDIQFPVEPNTQTSMIVVQHAIATL